MTMACTLTVLGAKFLAKLARGDTDALPILYIGLGDDSSALDPYQVTLGNEITDRVEATPSYGSTFITLTGQFTGLTEGTNYAEYGVFDSAYGGIMFSRHLPYELTPADRTTGTVRQVPSDGTLNVTVQYYIAQGAY